jgi:hypothetical protein
MLKCVEASKEDKHHRIPAWPQETSTNHIAVSRAKREKYKHTDIHMPKPHKCLCGFITINNRTDSKTNTGILDHV